MSEISRTERLLAYLVLDRLGDRSQEYRALRLSRAGFANPEIADLLETTTASVAQMLYVARKGRTTAKTSRAKSPARTRKV
jgi:hypothetical protein